MKTLVHNHAVGRFMREPLCSIVLDKSQRIHQPGEMLRGEYQIDAVDPADILAVELSVLWYTEGKGDEDLAVHYFERHTPDDGGPPMLHELHRFEVVLPNSPLSYEGVLIKLRWCVRLRVFLRQGKDVIAERDFQLGEVPYARPVKT
ncbi:MAG TPA: hypothetical protein VHX65_12495 [Pirellulales bacterium]|nr:hypothetical protein [Pirellulales bacterium]